MSETDFERLFERIGPLAGRRPREFTITRMPGYTNRNYRLHNRSEDWVLRVPRNATNRFIDRAGEAANQALAAGLDIAPRAAWRDRTGLSLTPTLSARGLRAADLADDEMLRRVATIFARLHRSGLRFEGRVDLGELLQRYHSLLPAALQQRYRRRVDAALRLLRRLGRRDCTRVPSHNDPVLENLLLARERLWLIDWEYSAMASPYWDLAALCNAADLDRNRSLDLLSIYCEGSAVMEESLLFDYRSLLQLLADCWMAALAD